MNVEDEEMGSHVDTGIGLMHDNRSTQKQHTVEMVHSASSRARRGGMPERDTSSFVAFSRCVLYRFVGHLPPLSDERGSNRNEG